MLINRLRWLREKEDDGKSGGSGGNTDKSLEELRKENEQLKAKHKELEPKIAKLEDAENKRIEAAKKKAEDDKKKEVGAEKLLEERTEQLKSSEERVAVLEKRERDRVKEAFDALPEEVQEAIGGLEKTLSLEDWSKLVEKQQAFVSKVTAKDEEGSGGSSSGGFMKPGAGKDNKGYVPTPKAAEILASLGKGEEAVTKLLVTKHKDEQTGQVAIRFGRQVGQFFKDMRKVPVRRVSVSGQK